MDRENNFTPESADAEKIKIWEKLVQEKSAADETLDSAGVEMAAMTELFEQRKGEFSPSDLDEDAGGGWKTFEQKVRRIFPEIPERHFTAMKAAVTMELCGL